MKTTYTWPEKIKKALQSNGYDLLSKETVNDICERTGLPESAVTSVLAGSDSCTVKALTAVAEMLNLPPAEFLNSTTSILSVYSVDGGSPVVLSIPRNLPEVAARIGGASLLYARNLDGSFYGLHEDAIVACSREMVKPVVGKLYLLESDVARFVRRCVALTSATHDATMSDEANSKDSYSVVRYAGLHSVSSTTPIILGEVLFSIMEH